MKTFFVITTVNTKFTNSRSRHYDTLEEATQAARVGFATYENTKDGYIILQAIAVVKPTIVGVELIEEE